MGGVVSTRERRFELQTEARSNRSSVTVVPEGGRESIEAFNRFAQFKSCEEPKRRSFEIREFSKCVTAITCSSFRGQCSAKSGRQVGRMRYGNRVKLMGGEFAQENEVLTLDNTVPWQKFTETAETKSGPTRVPFLPSSHNARVTQDRLFWCYRAWPKQNWSPARTGRPPAKSICSSFSVSTCRPFSSSSVATTFRLAMSITSPLDG